jgi:hypothetical protein
MMGLNWRPADAAGRNHWSSGSILPARVAGAANSPFHRYGCFFPFFHAGSRAG